MVNDVVKVDPIPIETDSTSITNHENLENLVSFKII